MGNDNQGLSPKASGLWPVGRKYLPASYLDQLQFSACGMYLYSVDGNVLTSDIAWPTLYSIMDSMTQEDICAWKSQTTQPFEQFRLQSCYVSGDQRRRIRVDDNTGILSMDEWKHSNNHAEDLYWTRFICVTPDTLRDQTTTDMTMIRPKSSSETGRKSEKTDLVFIHVPSTAVAPVLIRTGTQSEEMLGGDEWFITLP